MEWNAMRKFIDSIREQSVNTNAPESIDKNQAQKKAALAAAQKATEATGTNTGEPIVKQGSSADTVKEEAEQIDEISKATLGSYVKKASLEHGRQMSTAQYQRSRAAAPENKGAEYWDNAHDKQAKKRLTGISKAVGKLTKEDLEFTEEVDETIEYKTIDIVVNEADKNYDGYFKAAMKAKGIKHPGELKSDDEKKKFFNKVDAGFKAKNEEVFVEAYMRSDIEDRIKAHTKAGNKISDVTHTTKAGEGYHAYVVTEPSGKRTRHIFHGNSRKLETMSPAPKSKEAHEAGEDEDDK